MKPAETQQGRLTLAMLRQALVEFQPIYSEMMCGATVINLIHDAATMLGNEIVARTAPLTGKETVNVDKPRKARRGKG